MVFAIMILMLSFLIIVDLLNIALGKKQHN